MNMGKFQFCLPRVLAIIFIAFLSVFALDAFDEPNWPLALFMHLIPNFLLLVILAVAWKKAKIGGILFLLAGLFAAGFFHGLTAFLITAVPAFVIGILFLISNMKKYAGINS